MIMLIIAAAGARPCCFHEQIPRQLKALLDAASISPTMFMVILSIALLIAGTVLESLSLMIILIPVLAPMGAGLGIPPEQLGLLLVLIFTLGGITPPVGTITFTVCAITGCRLGEFTRAFLPFFAGMLLVCLPSSCSRPSPPGCQPYYATSHPGSYHVAGPAFPAIPAETSHASQPDRQHLPRTRLWRAGNAEGSLPAVSSRKSARRCFAHHDRHLDGGA